MRKKKISIYWVIFVFIIVMIALLSSFIVYQKFYSIPNCNTEINGNAIENSYNNLLSGGQLCRVNDKLYFNYEKNGRQYGLVEISENGSKRIYKTPKKTYFPSVPYGLINDPIFSHNGNLYKVTGIESSLQYFDNGFKDKFSLDKKMHEKTLGKYCINNEKIFFCFSDNNFDCHFSVYENNKIKYLVDNVDSFYMCDNQYFYLLSHDNSIGIIYKYDLKNNIATEILRKESISEPFFIEGDNLICKMYSYNAVTIVNLGEPEKNLKTIELPNNNKSNSVNVYNGNVYISSSEGLFVYNLKSEKTEMICEGNVKSSYFVDDKYIYYIKSDETLWRMTYDKSINEKVYG